MDDYTKQMVGRELERLRQENTDLREALLLTQDSARMAAFVFDPRVQMSPAMAVKQFNSMFPEIKRLATAPKEGGE